MLYSSYTTFILSSRPIMNILSFLKILIVASLYLPAHSSSCDDKLKKKDCRRTLGCSWFVQANPQLCLQCEQVASKKRPCNRKRGCQWDGTICASAECSKYTVNIDETWSDKKRKRKLRRAKVNCRRLTECRWLPGSEIATCSKKSLAPSGAPTGTSGL